MKISLSPFALALSAALSFAILPGCESQSTSTVSEAEHEDGDHDHDEAHDHEDGDHDGHDHDGEEHSHDFDSIGDALGEIVSLRDTIRDGFANDDVDAAHDPLHHMGEVLIAVEEVVNSMDDSDQKTAASEAVKSLLDDFTAVDDSLHGPDGEENGKSYDDVSASIDAAIDSLKQAAGGDSGDE